MNKKRILMGLGAFAFLGLTTVLTSCGGEKTYTVKFLDGQTELSSSTVTSGYNVEVPTAPTSDGKIFNGWYADEALTKPFDFGSIIEGDTNVYAAWVNEFTVTFKDGSKILSTTTVTSGYNVKAPANPTAKSGKTFAGWFADAALTKPFNFGSVITSATTVYAKWDSVYHNVNLYIDGNTLWKTVAIEEGETLTYEGAPTKDYREFANKWYTDAACTNLFNTATAVEEEFNLYAGWTAKMDVAESKFDFDAFQKFCGGGTKVASTSEFTDGKFTLDAGMYFDNGPLLNTQGKNIVFDTIGNGTVSFEVESKSTGNPLILSIYKLPLGTDVSKTDFSKETAVYDKETSNGLKLNASFAVEKGYRYVIKTAKSAGYTALSLSENVEVSAPEKIEVDSNKNQFIAGTELDLSLTVTEKYVNTSTKAVMAKDGDKKGYTVDTSKVDMTKAGTYKVTVNFTDSDDYGTYPMSAEFEVEVFDLKEIVLGFNATEKLSTNTKAGNGVYYNNKVAQVLGLNDELDLSALTIKAVSTEEGFFELYKNKQTFEAENSSLTVSSIDTSTAGEKEVTVTLTLNGVEKTATFKVNVVNTAPAYDKVNNVVKTYVDPTYTGVIGAEVNGANTFNTIQQALDYLALQDKYDNIRKEIKLAEGTYNEKLEIEIPNLTIVGADNLADSSKYVISWNSLYGVTDESGYPQETDSTQTVAVRETAENCVISGITIQNVYNTIDSYDDVYPGSGERGLALLIQADKFVMEKGRLLGWQDTLETFKGRQVFNNCFIQGCVDYIFGTNSTTVFNGCEIHTVKSKASSKADAAAAYVTAYKGASSFNNDKTAKDDVQYGAIFNACNFTVADDFVGYVCIGRSWAAYAAVTVIDSTFSDKFATTANKLIHNGLGVSSSTSTLKYFFYNNKKEDGTDFVVEEDITDVTHSLSQEQITALHLDKVEETLDELFKLENGKVTYSDYWNPVAKTTTIEVHDSEDNVIALYDVNAYVGKTLTQSQINAIKDLISFNLNANTQVLDGIFTDMSYETAFDNDVSLKDTDNNVVYAKIKKATPHDVTMSYSQETGATNTGWEATISTSNYTSVSMTPGLVTYKKDGAPAVAGAPAFTDGVNTYWMEPKTGSIKSPTITDTGVKEIYVSIYGGTSDTSDALEIDITAYDSSNAVVGKTTASTSSGKKSGYASLTTGGSTTEEFIKVSAAEGKAISYFVVSLPGRKVGADTYDNTKQYGVTKINAKYTWYEFEGEEVSLNYSYEYSNIDLTESTKYSQLQYKHLAKITDENWDTKNSDLYTKDGDNYTKIASYEAFEAIKTGLEGTADSTKVNVYDHDQQELTTSTLNNEGLSVVGSIKYRSLYQNGLGVIEAAAVKNDVKSGLSVTFLGKGRISFTLLSNGKENSSAFALVDANGNAIAAAAKGTSVTDDTTANNYKITGTAGGEAAIVTFDITKAGTYSLLNLDTTNALRFASVSMTDTYTATFEKKYNYVIDFDCSNEAEADTSTVKNYQVAEDIKLEKTTGTIGDDFVINVDASSGKLYVRKTNGDTQFNAGTKLSFTAPYDCKVTLVLSNGSAAINGITNNGKEVVQQFAKGTTVEIVSTASSYLKSLSIEQVESLQAFTAASIEADCSVTDILKDSEFDVTTLTVKAFNADKSYFLKLAAKDYTLSTIDTSTIGEKTVTVTYGTLTTTFKVNVAETIDNSISETMAITYKGTSYTKSKLVSAIDPLNHNSTDVVISTATGTTQTVDKIVYGNGTTANSANNWLTFAQNGTISFDVKSACTIYLYFMNGANSITVKLGDSEITTTTATTTEQTVGYAYAISGAGTVTITATNKTYLGAMEIVFA